MTPELIERLAREAGLPLVGAWADGGGLATHASMELRKFWSLAMEHAAGICDEKLLLARANAIRFELRNCAAAIREAAK